MTRFGRRWWSWPLAVLAVGSTVGSAVLYALAAATGRIPTNPVDAVLGVHPLIWTIPGVVVLLRADWHPVGWMLLGCGAGYAISFSLTYPEIWTGTLGVPPAWGAWIADGWGNSIAFLFTVCLLSVFPDGLPSVRGRRRGAVLRIGAGAAATVVAALGAEMGGFEGNFYPDRYANPTGLGVVPPAVAGWVFLVILVGMVASAISLLRASRRVDEATRRQYRWVLFPFGLATVMILTAIPLSSIVGDLVWLPVALMYVVLPVAFSIAMVRTRLWDIDRLVTRTVTYALVAVVVAGLYAIPVVVLPEVLGLSGDFAVAGATLAAAAAFTPIRRRVQALVDRRFDRARYDATRIVAGLGGRVQALTDSSTLAGEVGVVAATALRPASVDLWIKKP